MTKTELQWPSNEEYERMGKNRIHNIDSDSKIGKFLIDKLEHPTKL